MNRFLSLEISVKAASKYCPVVCGILTVGSLIGWLTVAGAALGQSDIVFMTSDDSIVGPSNLVRFDAGVETFAIPESGSHAFHGVTVLNDELLVSDYLADSIRRYSPSGSYLGDFALPGFSPTYLETDGSGNVYTTSFPLFGPSTARRYNSAGAATQSINFGTTRELAGIDADANGNIYVAETTGQQLYKHTANGTYINQISLGFYPRDLAIDEVGKRLYIAVNTGGIKIFDISAAVPTLVGSMTTPANAQIQGLHFAVESGNILATDAGVDGSNDPRGLEYSPSGTLLREYRPTTAYAALDITTFVAPEPADYNDNGVWDAADYVMWRKGEPAADGNGDGFINERDYQFWRARFGQPAPINAGALAAPASSAAVPEPGTNLLLSFGVLGVLAMRRPASARRFVGAAMLATLAAAPITAEAITIDMVTVGNPGNAPDNQIQSDGTTGYGSVGYNYQIGKYEVDPFPISVPVFVRESVWV